MYYFFPTTGTWLCHICVSGKDREWEAATSADSKDKPSNSRVLATNGKMKFGLIRRKYEYKHSCATPGCDGSGNINSIMSNHRRCVSTSMMFTLIKNVFASLILRVALSHFDLPIYLLLMFGVDLLNFLSVVQKSIAQPLFLV